MIYPFAVTRAASAAASVENTTSAQVVPKRRRTFCHPRVRPLGDLVSIRHIKCTVSPYKHSYVLYICVDMDLVGSTASSSEPDEAKRPREEWRREPPDGAQA